MTQHMEPFPLSPNTSPNIANLDQQTNANAVLERLLLQKKKRKCAARLLMGTKEPNTMQHRRSGWGDDDPSQHMNRCPRLGYPPGTQVRRSPPPSTVNGAAVALVLVILQGFAHGVRYWFSSGLGIHSPFGSGTISLPIHRWSTALSPTSTPLERRRLRWRNNQSRGAREKQHAGKQPPP